MLRQHQEMYEAVLINEFQKGQILQYLSAAVADYKPKNSCHSENKKDRANSLEITVSTNKRYFSFIRSD